MKTYEIRLEPVVPGFIDKNGVFIKTGDLKDKWNIYYYTDGVIDLKEFYSYDGVTPANDYKIREGYGEPEKIKAEEIDIDSVIEKIKEQYELTPKIK